MPCTRTGRSRKAGVWRVSSTWKGPETQDHMWRCQEKQHAVIREQFMTKKDEEELRKESRLTQAALLQRREELITWNETHRKDEVCAKTAAEKMREEMGDESGGTDLEQVSLKGIEKLLGQLERKTAKSRKIEKQGERVRERESE